MKKTPADVTITAREIVAELWHGVGDHQQAARIALGEDDGSLSVKTTIRAILAERERCAQIAEAFRETTTEGRAELAAAIRGE